MDHVAIMHSATCKSMVRPSHFHDAASWKLGCIHTIFLLTECTNKMKRDTIRLMRAIVKGDTDVVCQLLSIGTIDLNNCGIPSPLSVASEFNQLSITKLLLQAGADPNLHNGAPLIWAADNNNMNMAVLLVAAGADVSAEEYCAMRTAEAQGHTYMTKYLSNLKQS